jgi:uncharacterized membrane protein
MVLKVARSTVLIVVGDHIHENTQVWPFIMSLAMCLAWFYVISTVSVSILGFPAKTAQTRYPNGSEQK